MNILFCSVGRRGELVKNFRQSMKVGGCIIAVDNSKYAPALYLADKQYIVPKIYDETYIDVLLDICKKEHIDAVATFIDPEIEILAANRERFEKIGVQVLVPYKKTAALCFDKFEMYKFLVEHGIPTVQSYGDIENFKNAYDSGEIAFPVFVKPRTGSGSVGTKKVESLEELELAMQLEPALMIQEFMSGADLDADVYVDTVSGDLISVFSKKKIATTIGGASKTVSFKDSKLVDQIKMITNVLELNGPNDMDFFFQNGEYYLSEINPRFGGAYLHAYGAGVDFIKLIENNINGIANIPQFDNYEEDVVMMMYDSVVIKRNNEMMLEYLG